MAGSSLLTLIDDIATILDDVAVLSKVAAKKTSGVLGDDLALNANQVTGVSAHREIPVVLGVAKGSLVNKLILVPSALLISSLAPFLVTPLLVIGGGFLCFEGFEKVFEKIFHKKTEPHQPEIEKLTQPELPLDELEKEKIKGAVRTDFVLSAEIIIITLGTVATAPLMTRFMVLTTIALVMTIGVYGLVAMIVRMDDVGLHLKEKKGDSGWTSFQRFLGRYILLFAPLLMKFLGIAGTVAMFLVGGGIIVHAISPLHHLKESLSAIPAILLDGGTGLLAGAIIASSVFVIQKLKKSIAKTA